MLFVILIFVIMVIYVMEYPPYPHLIPDIIIIWIYNLHVKSRAQLVFIYLDGVNDNRVGFNCENETVKMEKCEYEFGDLTKKWNNFF